MNHFKLVEHHRVRRSDGGGATKFKLSGWMLASTHRGLLLSFMRSFMSDFKSEQLPLSVLRSAVGAFSALLPERLFTLNLSECRTSPATLLNSLSDILNLDTVWKRQRAGGGVCCGENNEASQNFLKTALPPKRHNASLWRLNVADCVCWRIWKEEGGEAGRM